ncbi:hypothetical protein [Streptomyces anulatus]|uniref:hypothetical protein n=1 Tax=Streptomyces anulatus TaxID=1892 RepID=UPI003254A46F
MMESFFKKVARVWPTGRLDLQRRILPTPTQAAELIAPCEAINWQALSRVSADGMHCTLVHAVGPGRDDVDVDAPLSDVRASTQALDPFALTFARPSVDAVDAVAVEISGGAAAVRNGRNRLPVSR